MRRREPLAGGREASDVTDASGSFSLGNAPTGEVTVVFRDGDCEASFPLGGVISNSTITLSDVSFLCADDPGSATPTSISETFRGVARDNPGDEATLCVRVGSDDRNRTVPLDGAAIEDENGQPITAAALEENDLLEVTGDRSTTGSSFSFATDTVRIVDRDVEDVCDDDPFT